jgi:hypothetical protein
MKNRRPCPPEFQAALLAAYGQAERAEGGDFLPLDLLMLADKLADAGHEHADAFGELARAPCALPPLHRSGGDARPMAAGSWWCISCEGRPEGGCLRVHATLYEGAPAARLARRALVRPLELFAADPPSRRHAFERLRVRLAAALLGVREHGLAARYHLLRNREEESETTRRLGWEEVEATALLYARAAPDAIDEFRHRHPERHARAAALAAEKRRAARAIGRSPAEHADLTFQWPFRRGG